jgi:hypothetical protein
LLLDKGDEEAKARWDRFRLLSGILYRGWTIWRFLLQSEIARTAIASIESRPSHLPYTEAELELLRFADEAPFDLRGEFAKRFEDAIGFLQASNITGERSVSAGRDLLNEALHAETIRRLRKLLGPVFSGRDRVAVLIDNLDKAWDRRVDLAPLSQLLLGLLGAVGRVSQDFEREDSWRQRIELSLVVFLRSDIYAYLQRAAREPDKIPSQVLSWTNREMLLRLIEERFSQFDRRELLPMSCGSASSAAASRA